MLKMNSDFDQILLQIQGFLKKYAEDLINGISNCYDSILQFSDFVEELF